MVNVNSNANAAGVRACLAAWLVSSVLFLGVTGSGSMAQTSDSLPESMGVLREYRTKAEHSASLLKRMQGHLTDSQYQHSETLYVDAKAAVDRWIEVLIIDLESKSDADMSEGQRNVLNKAAIKADTFMQYVAALAQEDQERGWSALIGIIPDAFTALVDGGIKVWREFRSVGTEKRESLVRRLEDLRWRKFEEIPAS